MITQFAIGVSLVALTKIVGAFFIVIAAERLMGHRAWLQAGNLLVRHVLTLTFMTIWLVFGLILIMILWALTLFALGIFGAFEAALYFAMISFTTLGFGDIILPNEWRLLSGFIAIDGFILFGLNTAFLFEVLRRLRQNDLPVEMQVKTDATQKRRPF